MIYLLDTDMFTLAHQARRGLREQISAVTIPDEVVVSIATRIEVLQGRYEAIKKAATAVELLAARARLRQSEQYLHLFRELDIDQLVGDRFDGFRAERKYNKMDRGDLLYACIALTHHATLVTRNVEDYKLVPGLTVENWAD
ncbi:type II toxin-antitoxin system VapC family toxin [bacterium]|nr:type II toxin-antitoxin system VapC family toxin [bacterium]